MSRKVKVGDVFLVPIDGDRYGIGQVAGDWKGELYLVVYDVIVGSDAEPNDIDEASPVFASLSLDAKLRDGDWPVIGNRCDNIAHLPQPFFQVGYEGQPYLESRDRSVFRPATAIEAAKLRQRKVIAPVRLEKAVKARHGIGEWLERYDELLSEYAFESARLVQT